MSNPIDKTTEPVRRAEAQAFVVTAAVALAARYGFDVTGGDLEVLIGAVVTIVTVVRAIFTRSKVSPAR